MSEMYFCAVCGGEITVKDNLNGGLISVNVDGHAKAAHRECPVTGRGIIALTYSECLSGKAGPFTAADNIIRALEDAGLEIVRKSVD